MAHPTSPDQATPVSDDTFHILRECRALYLKQLGQLLQEAERVPPDAVVSFQKRVAAYFDEMTSSQRRSGFDVADGLTASRISLVDESALELEIRLGEFTARLMESTGGDLWRVYLRFVTLLKRPDLTTADNPVGPKGISLGLMDFCAKMGESHENTLARVDRLETYFTEWLTVLYSTLNNFLAERHIGPAVPTTIAATEPSPQPANTAAHPNPAATLQQSLFGGNTSASTFSGPATSLFSQSMLEHLLARLDELEKSGKPGRPALLPLSPTATNPSLEALIPGLFSSDEDDKPSLQPSLDARTLGIPSGAPEAATIDALAMIFEAIFLSPTLPDAIKAALSSLQIPTLKAAMLDAGFFSTHTHPARQLLDKIARAALGLPPDISSHHPICTAIETIASHIRREFTHDTLVFERQIGELNALIAQRDEEVAQSAEPYLPLLHQLDRRTQATRRSRQAIEQCLANGAPADITAFLRNHWQKVLIVVWMEHGEQSTAWQEHKAVASDLLWSIQPKTDVDERKLLARKLQPMLQLLNAGMARIGLPDAEQAAFLDTCFALQTAAMRGLPLNDAKTPPAAPSESTAGFDEISAGNLLLRVFDETRDYSTHAGLRPPPARTGSWLVLSLMAEPPVYGRVCHVSPESGLLLVANPAWNFAIALHPNILENMIRDGSARLCSNDSLFDSAAEQALLQKGKP